MNGRRSLISLVMALLFVSSALYFAAFLVSKAQNARIVTAAAEYVSQQQTVQVQGIIVRTERPVYTAGIDAEPLAGDGQAVAVGAIIADAGGREITAPETGLYVRATDGYEHLTPDMLDDLTPTELDKLLTDRNARSCPAGKLITSFAWYFACNMDKGAAVQLAEGSAVDLTPAGKTPVSAVVIHISEPDSGRCAVVFRCTTGIQDTVGLREMTADLLPSRTEGLSVPSRAIRWDDSGNPFVYVLSASRAEKRAVTILSEDEEYTLVAEDSSADGLHAGNTIIVSSPDDLQEGMLIR